MKKISTIKETLVKYEGYKVEDIELISTIIGESAGTNLYKAGLTSLDDIYTYGIKDLIKLTGIRKDKAIQLLALYELCKRNIKSEGKTSITSPVDIFNYCKDMMYEEQEVLRLICLNTKNQILASKDVFKGGINTSVVDVKIILRDAIRLTSSSIVIVHNHPSGDPSPSKEDLNVTARLNEACRIMGISLIDHIVVGKNQYFSFKEKNLL